jgi:aryl-alcohol dehydrogenase-like predicted oxidoreductase
VSPIGFGAFKIGRNVAIKYPDPYSLPSGPESERLLNIMLDMGVTLFDTAPAYGLSEQRIGAGLAHRRREFTLCSKVGETFDAGRSTYDFSSTAVRRSVQQSLRHLRTDVIDILLVHADDNDVAIAGDEQLVETLRDLREAGLVQAIGFSGKTAEGALAALGWADVLMVEYHAKDGSNAAVIAEADAADVGVLIKKGLASGRLPAEEAIPYILGNPAVASMIIGTLSPEHMRANVAMADRVTV